jgi:hypothetical protein
MSKLHLDDSAKRRLDGPHINHGRRAPAHRMDRTSIMDAAPQRTVSRKASSRSGVSKPVGAGRAICLMIAAPGSSFHITWSSSPRPLSPIEDSVTQGWL